MIPRLYPAGTTSYTTEGLGALVDCISCETSSSINGVPEINIVYPAAGLHADDIAERCIIVADEDVRLRAQPYVVQVIDKATPGIMTIYGVHAAVDAVDRIALEPYEATSLQTAIAGLSTYATETLPVTISTQLVGNIAFTHAIPSSVKLALGGMEGSILDTYGGEWDFDGDTITLKSRVGSDNGVLIRYGKNLASLDVNADWSAVFTGIYPYWVNRDSGAVTQMSPPVVSLGSFPFTKIFTLDTSDEYEDEPTSAQLLASAQAYASANHLTSPRLSWKVVMKELRASPEYASVSLLEAVALGDSVTIYYPDFGVDATARVVSERYDVIRGQYNDLTIGSVRASLASTIVAQTEAVDKAVKTVEGTVAEAIKAATEAITGNTGGYVVTILNADGKPQELLVIDEPDYLTAQHVWRWNASGLGFSSHGYGGPYETAMTADGKIVADMITAGTLDGSIIQAGTVYFDQLADDTIGYISGEVDGLRTRVEKAIEDLDSALSSQITQTASDIRVDFTQQINDVGDVADANNDAINEINSHIVIAPNSMKFLVDGSEYELEITNDGIVITGAGGESVAEFTADGVLLPQETVIPEGGTLTMGNFKWMPRSSGNLSMVRI